MHSNWSKCSTTQSQSLTLFLRKQVKYCYTAGEIIVFILSFCGPETEPVYRRRTLKSANDSQSDDDEGGAPWEKCDFEKSTSPFVFLAPYIALILLLFVGKQTVKAYMLEGWLVCFCLQLH